MNIDNRNICLRILEDYKNSNIYINNYINNYFTSKDLSEPDRKFINKLILGVVRLKGRYDYIISKIYHGDYQKLKPKLKDILRLGCYQIEKMNSVPDHAAIFTMVELTKKHLKGYEKLVNAILRNFLKEKDKFNFTPNTIENYPLLSHPSWLIKRWVAEFGEQNTIELCKYNNTTPDIWFRINRELSSDAIYHKISNLSLKYTKHKLTNLFFKVDSVYRLINSSIFKEGQISIQNPINAFIVEILDPQNNEIIIDGCSAPGGKGALMALKAPKSIIYSIELNQNKIPKIQESINRHNLKNINILNLDMAQDILPLADKILLDVPCSGTGVINRRVDLRWKRKKDDIINSSKLQYQILSNASKYVKKGGLIVYSTCSIEIEENTTIINMFLNKNKHYVLENCGDRIDSKLVKNNMLNIFPGEYDLDGGFAALLRKI